MDLSDGPQGLQTSPKEKSLLTLVEEFNSMNEAALLQASLSQFLGAPGIPGLVATTPQFLPLFLHDFSSVSVSSLIRTQSQD